MSNDRVFVDTLLQWSAQGHAATLVTVVHTWGSSPRPIGSLMAVCDDGRRVGSISGGCIEEDLIARLHAQELSLERPARVAYGTTRESAARFGLPCGGRLEVVVERVRDSASWKAIAAALGARQARVRCVHLEDGDVEFTDDGPDFRCDEHLLVRRFGPRWKLLLVGAGDLARQVVHCAAHLDYDIVVCEPRAEVRAAWDLPETALDARMPDEVATEADERTALITLTHDPRIDDLALMQALTGRAFYVGAVGSQATSASRRERLLTLGLPPQAVADLHAPVGLSIGSRTPAEIAISILAEVTAVRRRLEQRASIGVECVS